MKFARPRGRPVAAVLLVVAATACDGPPVASTAPVRLEWHLEPAPARVGSTTVHFSLRDTVAGVPVEGAQVHVEGNMSHPGMRPSLATAVEVEPGRYAAGLELTMGGDWYLLFKATLADSGRWTHQVNLPGVRAGALPQPP